MMGGWKGGEGRNRTTTMIRGKGRTKTETRKTGRRVADRGMNRRESNNENKTTNEQ